MGYVVTVEHQDTKVKSEIIIISLHGNVENQQNAAIAREITHQDIKNVQDTEKKICEEMAVNKLSKMEAKAIVNQTQPERTMAEVVRTPPSSPNNNDQIKEQQIDSLKGIIEEILERKLSVLNSDEMLRKKNSMEEERMKDKETIEHPEHLRSKLTSQQDPQLPSSNNEMNDIKRTLEKLESE